MLMALSFAPAYADASYEHNSTTNGTNTMTTTYTQVMGPETNLLGYVLLITPILAALFALTRRENKNAS